MRDVVENCSHPNCTGCSGVSRRAFLSDMGLGFVGLVLGSLLHDDGIFKTVKGNDGGEGSWAPPDGKPHFAPRAKKIIWLNMRGGVSHMESFDPKPALNKYAGKTIGDTPYKEKVFESPHLENVREALANNVIKTDEAKIYPLQIGYRRGGRSGIEVSDWWPHVRECIDDIAVVRSMWTLDNNHGAQMEWLTGRHLLDGCFPTIGSWVHYGLGTLNENLPQFISMGPSLVNQCFEGLGADYLGPEHSGVEITVDPENPLPFARPELDISIEEQRIKLEFVNGLNRLRAIEYPNDSTLRARIQSYELAFRMQTAVPEVMHFEEENEPTRRLYGLDHDVTRTFGQQCLAARRFAERGVRFIQIFHGGGAAGAWDAHSGLRSNHSGLTAQVDKPIAGLLTDLKRRGMFDDTVVVWTTEFGRTPGAQGADGRDHHNYGFSIWLAGAGIQGGIVHGQTDELGFHAVEDRHYITDIHATLLDLLGLDPRRLEVPGRKRLEIDFGHPIADLYA